MKNISGIFSINYEPEFQEDKSWLINKYIPKVLSENEQEKFIKGKYLYTYKCLEKIYKAIFKDLGLNALKITRAPSSYQRDEYVIKGDFNEFKILWENLGDKNKFPKFNTQEEWESWNFYFYN